METTASSRSVAIWAPAVPATALNEWLAPTALTGRPQAAARATAGRRLLGRAGGEPDGGAA